MTPKAKENLSWWLTKRLGGWTLFMLLTGVMMLALFQVAESTADLGWLITIIAIPSWWLPMSLAKFNPCNVDFALVPVGLILHFLLWVALWEWRGIRDWMKCKPTTKRTP